MLCDGSPGFASLCQVILPEMCITTPFFVLRVYKPCSQGSAELDQPTISAVLPNMVLPPNSSYPQMYDRDSSPAWTLVPVEPRHELVHLSTTKENIWGILGGWAVKLICLFTGLAGLTGSLGCSLSGTIRETTKPRGRGQDEQKDWWERNVSKLLDQFYHQTVPDYPLYKHTPYLLLETVSWVS